MKFLLTLRTVQALLVYLSYPRIFERDVFGSREAQNFRRFSRLIKNEGWNAEYGHDFQYFDNHPGVCLSTSQERP